MTFGDVASDTDADKGAREKGEEIIGGLKPPEVLEKNDACSAAVETGEVTGEI